MPGRFAFLHRLVFAALCVKVRTENGKAAVVMEQAIYLATRIGTGLVLAAAFVSLIASRFGVPCNRPLASMSPGDNVRRF